LKAEDGGPAEQKKPSEEEKLVSQDYIQ
jgi:hypothetical protein